MKIGFIGLPQTGKKTLFRIITGHSPSENELVSGKSIEGIAEIRDPRFEKLVDMYKPESIARARINIVLLPRLEKDSFTKEEMLKELDDVDVLCHIVRTFKNDSVYHVSGSVDPKRDVDEINVEFILNDLAFIEKRMERIEKGIKKSFADIVAKEKQLLIRLKESLENEIPLRLISINVDEQKIIASYPLLTRKELIIALNISENDVSNTALADKFAQEYATQKIYLMQVSAKVEAEIAELESEAEREEFMKAAGITEPAVNILKRVCIKALNLVSFFGVGSDEVKQWTIPVGSTAPQAAGAIHSDLEKGFIRAEVMKYAELMEFGSEEKLKEKGKIYLKGKDYITEDGDILSIRFNI